MADIFGDYSSGASFWTDPDTGVSYWSDAAGNVVGSQAPGGNFVPTSGGGVSDYSSTDSANWPQLIKDYVGAGLTAVQAFQLNQINLERAKKGQPPLNPQQYAPTVNFGLSSQTITMALLGLGALLLVMRKR